MKFLLSSPAYNQDIQNKALAFYEVNALGAYYSTGVDHYRTVLLQKLRERITTLMPKLDSELRRRHISLIPDKFIHSDWSWEFLRTLAFRLGCSPSISDWFWEKSELRLDRMTAQLIMRKEFDAFIGTDHSCLATLRVARRIGKPAILVYLSPHHSAKKKWVDTEYEAFPELLTASTKRLMQLAVARNARRDQEARLADIIVTNSSFTTQTLIDANIEPNKIITVPYGFLTSITDKFAYPPLRPVKFMYVGNVAVHKGSHYLLQAWNKVHKQLNNAELHFFGSIQLPQLWLSTAPPNVFFHGSVAQTQLFDEYKKCSVLVFPTLFDGFGFVVTEAMAHGLPVITTPNAGAADLIESGKNGFLIPPKDVDALAEILVSCAEHPEILSEMRQHAVDTARTHSWIDVRVDFREKLGKKLGISLTAVK